MILRHINMFVPLKKIHSRRKHFRITRPCWSFDLWGKWVLKWVENMLNSVDTWSLCVGWYSGAAVVTIKKGNSITTSNSPSFTLLDSSYRLMWNSPSCSTEGWDEPRQCEAGREGVSFPEDSLQMNQRIMSSSLMTHRNKALVSAFKPSSSTYEVWLSSDQTREVFVFGHFNTHHMSSFCLLSTHSTYCCMLHVGH